MRSIYTFLVALACVILTTGKPRAKRSPYELVMDAELVTGPYRTTFSCEGLKYGYYADVDNDCKIFHICYPRTYPDGSDVVEHWSFICGNQTIFNQYSQTCSHYDESIPCEVSRDFYYLNERYGVIDEAFHRDEDVDSYNRILTESFGTRSEHIQQQLIDE